MKAEADDLARRALAGADDHEARTLRNMVYEDARAFDTGARKHRVAKTRVEADAVIAKANARSAARRKGRATP